MERLDLFRQNVSNNINSLLLTTRCDAFDRNQTLEQYCDKQRILLPAIDQLSIEEERFGITCGGKLKFTDLYSCLGIILINQPEKIALAAHITSFDRNIDEIAKNYLKQIDDIYDIKPTKIAFVSSQLEEKFYHKCMEILVKERYGLDNVERYPRLTVTYYSNSDKFSK